MGAWDSEKYKHIYNIVGPSQGNISVDLPQHTLLREMMLSVPVTLQNKADYVSLLDLAQPDLTIFRFYSLVSQRRHATHNSF